MAHFRIVKEVSTDWDKNDWNLCFQLGEYVYDNDSSDYGFRFIWRKPVTGHLQPARAQARIPSMDILESLVAAATKEGWTANRDDKIIDL